ncbi:MAG: DUF4349 domain-containing protein [Treponema sp.]|nr:DUF4349 domain-containing protein [Treponema sp.]
MKKRKDLFLLITLLILSGCSRGSAASSAPPVADFADAEVFGRQRMMDTSGAPRESPAGAEYAEEPPGGEVSRSRKLVRNADIHLRVQNPEAAEGPLTAAMAKYGAYASSKRLFENARYYTIRVPAASFDAFFAELAGMGTALSRTESAEDVTIRFYDLEGRLATKQELLKTFQSYLGKAQNIDEIMTVEKRIAELQQEIEWTGTEFRALADLVDYATINLELTGPAAAVSGPGLGHRITDLFGGFGDVAATGLVVLLGVVLYGLPGLLLLTFLFWLLFGRIGLVRKLWSLAAARKTGKKPDKMVSGTTGEEEVR